MVSPAKDSCWVASNESWRTCQSKRPLFQFLCALLETVALFKNQSLSRLVRTDDAVVYPPKRPKLTDCRRRQRWSGKERWKTLKRLSGKAGRQFWCSAWLASRPPSAPAAGNLNPNITNLCLSCVRQDANAASRTGETNTTSRRSAPNTKRETADTIAKTVNTTQSVMLANEKAHRRERAAGDVETQTSTESARSRSVQRPC